MARARGESPRDVNTCGGVLVAPNWVLTASHCRPAYENLESRELPVEVGVHIQADGTFAGRLRVVDYHLAPAPLNGERVDAALLKLDGDATEMGATVASLSEGLVTEGLATITVGLGTGGLGVPLLGYASVKYGSRWNAATSSGSIRPPCNSRLLVEARESNAL